MFVLSISFPLSLPPSLFVNFFSPVIYLLCLGSSCLVPLNRDSLMSLINV
eukprot:m.239474 g.239474  ORF g.239474 m.239474 type:complete len:50 (+) comp22590_c0_seq1:2232-2381(+)